MILKALKVERFGCLNPGALIERFDPHLTVIHGPNGAGKSTLFRALTYALYQRHGLAAQEALAQIVPHGREVGPRVEVTFEVDVTTWRLAKQFVRRPDVELCRLENGVFVPHAQGPAAEDRLRELLGSGRNPKGVAGAEYRGIGEILLVDQGALRLNDVSSLARDRLRLVIDQVGTTEGAHDLLAAVERRYSEVFGKGGGVRERSAIPRLEEELARLVARRDELEADRLRAEQLAGELTALEEQSPARAAEEIERLEAEVQEAWKLHVEVAQKRATRASLEADVLASRREAERLGVAIENLRVARAEHRRLTAESAEAEAKLRDLDEDARRAVRERDRAERAVAQTLDQERDLADRERALGDAKRAVDLSGRIPDLDDRLSRHAALSCRIEDGERAVAARRRPSAAEIARIREQVQALRSKERDGERLDVRVRITAESDVPVEVGPERIDLPARESREVVSGDAIEIRIPGLARIEVRAPGGVERVQLAREIEAARAAVHEIGLMFGTEDLARLEELAQERVGLEGELAQWTAARDGLFKTDRKAKEAMADLAAARLTLGDLIDRHPEWGGAPPEAASLVPIEQAIVLERKHLAASRHDRDALLLSRVDAAKRVADEVAKQEARQRELKLGLARCEATIKQLESGEPDDPAREARLVDARARMADAQRSLAACEADLDSLGDPQARIDRLTVDKRRLEAASRKAEDDRVRLTERLDQIRARGIWRELGDVGLEIENATERLERERLAADALKLLRDVLVREQAAAVETAVRPVADRVARMARFLFGSGAKPTLGEQFAPRALVTDGAELPVDLLSAGTQDQVALLARMALGELYAEKCGRHAFVLDDPLVNCDRERRGKLLELFGASRALQIVIFTCAPELYRGLPEGRCSFISMEDAKLRLASADGTGLRAQPA